MVEYDTQPDHAADLVRLPLPRVRLRAVFRLRLALHDRIVAATPL